MSRRRPSSAASRSTSSQLRSAHRPEARSVRRLCTTRCSASGPTLAQTDTPRRTFSSRYASGRRQWALEEGVSAVPRDEHRFHPGFDRPGLLGQRKAIVVIEVQEASDLVSPAYVDGTTTEADVIRRFKARFARLLERT
jgi:hypothetical protein